MDRARVRIALLPTPPRPSFAGAIGARVYVAPVRPTAELYIPFPMPIVFRSALLLVCSNVFMTFAWYAHLRNLQDRPWYVAVCVSWGIALFEYLLQVPANRIGATQLTLGQLKVMQEIITLSVFVPFAVFYMRQSLRLDYLWAALCLAGAAYFVFRPHGS